MVEVEIKMRLDPNRKSSSSPEGSGMIDLVESNDPRVIKTNRAIVNAFLDLMETKGLASMTVQDILDAALVNRKTFYRYYTDKYDLAERIGRSFLDEFEKVIDYRFSADMSSEEATRYIDEGYREWNALGGKANAIMQIRTENLDVRAEMLSFFRDQYASFAEEAGTSGDVDFQADLFACLMIETFEDVVFGDRPGGGRFFMEEFERLYETLEKTLR